MTLDKIFSTLSTALGETLIMVGFSTLFSIVIGILLAVVMVVTDKDGVKPNRAIYGVLDIIINIFRSFPFIILLVTVSPVTRLITGRSIGTRAAIVPLTIAAAPFVARVIESSLKEVDKGVIEAAKSLGATNGQIIVRIMIKESMPSIMSGIILTIISIIGYSAMAGSIGGGGLGAVAITYGYNRYDQLFMFCTVVVIIILVQIIQLIGNKIYKKLNR